MKANVIQFSIVALLILPGFFSCNQDVADNGPKYDYERDDSLPSDYLSKLGNIRVSIEELTSLYKTFSNEKYSYNSGMLNTPGKSSGYGNSKIQALNLGVYGADANYSVAFQQTQDIKSYLAVIYTMAQKLNVQSAFNKDLIEQLTSSDTTINKSVLLTKAYRYAENNLHSQQRARLATLMVTGGWIEGLYIVMSIMKSKPYDNKMNLQIFDNVYTYNDVKKMLEVFEKDCKDCKEILIDLETLNVPIDNLIHSKYAITQAEIDNLYTPLAALRNKLVSQI